MAEDYYTTLGVHRSASAEEIGRAYRELARKYHPDLNPDDPEAEKKFEEVQAAFEVLSHPEQRAAYNGLDISRETTRGSARDPGQVLRAVRMRSHYTRWSYGGGGEYLIGMLVATIIWIVPVVVGFGLMGDTDRRIDPTIDLVFGLVCCGWTPLYVIVMLLLASNTSHR